MPTTRDQHLLVKVARMYYEEGRSQQEIAQALDVSRPGVSRMLAAARERGIVEISVHDPAGRDLTLESELRAAFGLRDCRVAEVPGGDRALARVGDLGARWLLDTLRPEQSVGVSWGRTLQAVVRQVPDNGALNVEVVPLVGGLSSVDREITGEELVRDLAARLGGRFRRLHAPALLTTPASRRILLAEPSVQDALSAAEQVGIALVGIGSHGVGASAAIIDALVLDAREREEFERRQPVGDLCARFFDSRGRAIPGPVEDRVLAVSLDQLSRIPRVAGVAAGAEKAHGVLGALRSGTVDVLICDSALARALLCPPGPGNSPPPSA
ncbi:sugar-binding transcriptional regulator [Streptomyces spongiae]|uniref:Sugar-binding transcriptional regulator n=1 Tax=Streptomyces spongiae TaxID=565072 RepID=A0A5N8XDV2_9ACTN|nr:sugar-binding transcriptional regulator [Streptomyces spongiae]MPY57622.1 sugar-binding transcriptional regulator [Streptomyces spongiae]